MYKKNLQKKLKNSKSFDKNILVFESAQLSPEALFFGKKLLDTTVESTIFCRI